MFRFGILDNREVSAEGIAIIVGINNRLCLVDDVIKVFITGSCFLILKNLIYEIIIQLINVYLYRLICSKNGIIDGCIVISKAVLILEVIDKFAFRIRSTIHLILCFFCLSSGRCSHEL